MSVLIKGMEMPKNCDVCRFCGLGGASLEREVCQLNGRNRERGQNNRMETCPLIPVPPHGRLIDADAPIPLVDTHGKKIEVTVAHIIENNLGIVNAIIESEEEDDKNI